MDAREISIRRAVIALGLGEDVARAFIDARVPAAVAARAFARYEEDVLAKLAPRRDAYSLLGAAIGFRQTHAWLAKLPRWRGYEIMRRAGGEAAARGWLRSFFTQGPRRAPATPSAPPRRASIDERWAEVVDQINRENAASS